jgi:hypothetical protein
VAWRPEAARGQGGPEIVSVNGLFIETPETACKSAIRREK